MASCLSGGGAYHIDIVKQVQQLSTSPPCSSHSSPSSTISESSNSCNSSNSSISLKKPRAPRKRPNQTYNEAAALLSSLYPSIFNPKKSLKAINKRPNKDIHSDPLSFEESDNPDSVLLPPFPVPGPAAFLLHDSAGTIESVPFVPSPTNWVKRYSFRDPFCASSPISSPLSGEIIEDDFDTESILDEEINGCNNGEGIDSIMGNLAMDGSCFCTGSDNSVPIMNQNGGNLNSLNPYLKSLIGLGLCSKLEHLNRAFKNRGNGTDWYQSPAVPMKEIFTKFKAPAVPAEKKKSNKKKKSEKVVEKERREKETGEVIDGKTSTVAGTSEEEKSVGTRVKLGLKLNHDDVIKEWSERGPLFSEGSDDSPRPSAEALAKLAEIDLSPDGGPGGVREASVMRYKEKRRTRLFSKKIRYQVRKVNADQRPRMKASGRFVRSPSLLQQALDEEKLGG
ncbi:hypothetical protein LUZ60_001635 [Juncus effusus]|nr:hypothetical protein LUZ60_001635 [Juncus effusus]